jgi:hypothetical protein
MKHIIINKCIECPYKTTGEHYPEGYCSKLAVIALDRKPWEIIRADPINQSGIRKDCPLKDYPTTISEFLKQ